MSLSKLIRFSVISLLFTLAFAGHLLYFAKVLHHFAPGLAWALSLLLSVSFLMVQVCYFRAVFSDPGFVSEGVRSLTETEQREMRQETFHILEKVHRLLTPDLREATASLRSPSRPARPREPVPARASHPVPAVAAVDGE